MAQFLSDSFEGVAGTALETYNPAWAKVTALTGTAQLSPTGDRAIIGSGTAGYYRSDVTPPSADYSVSADVFIASTTAGKNVMIAGRMSATEQTFYGIRVLTGTGISLVRYTANVVSVLGTVNPTLVISTSVNVKLVMDGANLSVYINDVLSIGPISDGNITDAGHVGLRLIVGSGTQNQVDNLTAATLGAAPAGVDASAAWAEQAETSSVAVQSTLQATAAWSEAAETAAANIALTVQAGTGWTEGGEVTSASGAVGAVNSASLSWVEGSEGAVISAAASVATLGSIAEQSETHAATGQVSVRFASAWLEAGESFAAGLNIAGPQAIVIGWTETAEVFVLAVASASVVFAHAPDGSGYSPRRPEYQTRPAQAGTYRPAALQRNNR